MKYVYAFAIGFAAMILAAGFGQLLWDFVGWATEYMTKTQLALCAATVGGIFAAALVRWLNPPNYDS